MGYFFIAGLIVVWVTLVLSMSGRRKAKATLISIDAHYDIKAELAQVRRSNRAMASAYGAMITEKKVINNLRAAFAKCLQRDERRRCWVLRDGDLASEGVSKIAIELYFNLAEEL